MNFACDNEVLTNGAEHCKLNVARDSPIMTRMETAPPTPESSDVIQYRLIGDFCPGVALELPPGAAVQAEPGAMLYMTPQIRLDSEIAGGIGRGLKRKFLAGESLFMSRFIAEAPGARVAFAAPLPGQILPLILGGGPAILCQRSAYLCSSGEIDLAAVLTRRLRAGFFGGEGFILQKLSGIGLLFIHASGTLEEIELASGESIRADTGCLVGFEETVDYDIRYIGGLKKAVFGGEGLFLAELTGPGKVWLQTLPARRLLDGLRGSHRGEGGIMSFIFRLFS